MPKTVVAPHTPVDAASRESELKAETNLLWEKKARLERELKVVKAANKVLKVALVKANRRTSAIKGHSTRRQRKLDTARQIIRRQMRNAHEQRNEAKDAARAIWSELWEAG